MTFIFKPEILHVVQNDKQLFVMLSEAKHLIRTTNHIKA
jgi:hypothetical protein